MKMINYLKMNIAAIFFVNKYFTIGLLLTFSLFGIITAQQNEPIYKQITTKDGLQDNVTLSIAQDDNGIMWFGTRSGLVRYDGITLKTFSYDPNIADGLSGNNIGGLHVDKGGILWIGTINGLCHFDVRLDRPIKIPITIEEQIISASIEYITSSNNGVVWIGTLANGLISFDPIKNKFMQYLPIPNGQNSILSNRISSIICADDDKIWIGTSKGLNSFDPKTNAFTSYKPEIGNPNTISGEKITSLAEGENGDLWIGTLSSGLNRMNMMNGEIIVYKQDPNNKNSIGDNYISSILFTDSVVWFGSGRGLEALNRLDTKTGIVSKLKIATISVDLDGNGSVNDIYIDKMGIIWIAQSLAGIKYFEPNWKNYDHFTINNNRDKSLSNRIYGINPISDKRLWASTFSGLVLFDIEKGIVKNITEKNKLWLLNNNSVRVKDELWIPSRNQGIVRYNLKSNEINYFIHDPTNNNSISSNYVNNLYKDTQGIIWAGSRDGGLDRINPETNSIKRYNHIPGKPESLPENSIYAILEKNEEQLWVGTNGGLALFDKKREVFKNYLYDPNDTTSISSDQISYLLRSKSGVLWVSTYGGGLNVFDPKKEIFKRYTSQKNNLPDNTIYSTLEDENGKIWVSTAAGIARFSPDNENYDYLIDKPDYYKAAKFPNGNFGFSGPHGLLIFDPNKMKFNSLPPIISLFEFTVNGQLKSSAAKEYYKYNLNSEKEIELDYFQNDIGFKFTAAHYSDASKNKYKVYLEGYDKKWRSLGSTQNINYTNLDPGQYKIMVKAASAYDIWTREPMEFNIIIKHPWWKTWWAYTLYLVLIIGLLYFIRKFELSRRREKENKRFLEAENKRKSEELEEARQLQLSMLPKELPNLPNLDISVFMQTATEVGGDYYDFAIAADGSLNVAIGDATGHGMQAGTLVTLIKGLFTSDVSNKGILNFFNDTSRTIKEINLGRLLMAFSLLKINGKRLQYSSAGLPPMYIYRHNSKSVEEIDMQGMPLGAMKNFNYRLFKTDMNSGDCLLLLSDGYPELSNSENEQFGYARVKSQFTGIAEKQSAEIVEHLKNSASEWVDGKDPDDDVTFVVIKVK